jgi:type IV secretion system protein VirD4
MSDKQQIRNHGFNAIETTISAMVCLMIGALVATETFAVSVHFHRALGSHWSYVYPPWAIAQWWTWWHTSLSPLFARAFVFGGISSISLLSFSLISEFSRKQKLTQYADVHGTARWANIKDIKRAGLLADKGPYVGEFKRGLRTYTLRDNGPNHLLCFAPTRAGKGVGLVIPTLLTWPASVVVLDLKGENISATSAWRGSEGKNRILRFEPASSTHSVAWNPLDEIRVGTDKEYADISNLAHMIVDPDGKGLESHWQKCACALFVGFIKHVLHRRKEDGPATLAAINDLMSHPDLTIKEVYKFLQTYLLEGGERDPIVTKAIRKQLDRPPEEAGSVLSTAQSYIAAYEDPVIAKNTSHSDFRVTDLMHDKQPVSLYIVVEDDDFDRLQPLLRLIINTILRRLSTGLTFKKGLPKANYKHRLLMVIDEGSRLGKIKILERAFSFVAAYGIRIFFIAQDMTQLLAEYGQHEAISSNCNVQIFFAPNTVPTAELMSKKCGQTTIVKDAVTTSKQGWSTSVSRTTQEIARPLLTVDEALQLGEPEKDGDLIAKPGQLLIFAKGRPAIRCMQVLYFQNPELLRRAQMDSPVPSPTPSAPKPLRDKKLPTDFELLLAQELPLPALPTKPNPIIPIPKQQPKNQGSDFQKLLEQEVSSPD